MFLTGLARVAREAGLKVHEYPGWKNRTAHRGGMTKVVGVIWHHTATPANLVTTKNNPTRDYMVSGLGYPLANYGLGWDGSLDVLAAGTGAHAGKGKYPGVPNNDGNRHMIGVEVEGTIGLTWSAAQLEAAARLGAQLNREFGTQLLHIGHYEWAPGRKTDPTGIPGHMPALRAAIKRGYWATPVITHSTGKTQATPATTITKDWLTMASEEDVRKIVKEETDNLYNRILAGIKWAKIGHNDESLRTMLHEARAGAQQGYTRIVSVSAAQDSVVHAVAEAAAKGSGLTPEEVQIIAQAAQEGAEKGAQSGLAQGVTLEATVKSKEAN